MNSVIDDLTRMCSRRRLDTRGLLPRCLQGQSIYLSGLNCRTCANEFISRNHSKELLGIRCCNDRGIFLPQLVFMRVYIITNAAYNNTGKTIHQTKLRDSIPEKFSLSVSSSLKYQIPLGMSEHMLLYYYSQYRAKSHVSRSPTHGRCGRG